MPRKRKLSETQDTSGSAATATMPPPPEGAVERVTLEDLAAESGIAESAVELAEREGINPPDDEGLAPGVDFADPDAPEATGPHTYDVAQDGTVTNVQAVAAPKPATNGHSRHIRLDLKHGPSFVPERCKFCGGKCPPHPARLVIGRVLGTTEIEICAKCDEVFTEFLALLGQGEITVEIAAPGGARQTDMLDDLAAAVPGTEGEDHGDEDFDGPPTPEVAERIRAIAQSLPDSPFDQGGAAFCEGLPMDANPYIGPADQQTRREQWDDGWRRAQTDQRNAKAAGATAAVQSLADAFGAEVTVRALDHDGTELGRVVAAPVEGD